MLKTIQLYEQLSYFEASKDFASELVVLYKDLLKIRSSLDQQIDALIGKLAKQIINEKLPSKSGFFSGIHRWWKNLFGGHKNKKNPYYWQNKMGALGRTDIEPPSVEEYRILNPLAVSLFEATDVPKPMIAKILAGWSAQLKSVVQSHLDDMITRVREMIGRVSHDTAIPEKPKEPPEKAPESESPPEADAGTPRLKTGHLPDVGGEIEKEKGTTRAGTMPESVDDETVIAMINRGPDRSAITETLKQRLRQQSKDLYKLLA